MGALQFQSAKIPWARQVDSAASVPLLASQNESGRKITDFGLARSVLKQEHTSPGVVFGRASYLAPEQARGEVADARTDIYSLGIVLWELLTGQQYLQLANVDPVTEITNLIAAQRAYEMNSKVIQAADQMSGTITNIRQ